MNWPDAAISHNDELQKVWDDLLDTGSTFSDGDGVGRSDHCWWGSARVCGLTENLGFSWEGC